MFKFFVAQGALNWFDTLSVLYVNLFALFA